jgi:hypothetical protein
MKSYVDEICEKTAKNGIVIEGGLGGYSDGAVLTPLDFELDEFCGVWFVQICVALNRRFAVHRLDLGQARFRIMVESEVQHPEGISKNEALVKRDSSRH